MNSFQNAREAYRRPETPIRTLRSIEYELLARVTHDLAASWETRKTNFPATAAALHQNVRVWSTFATDVTLPENGLTPQLKAQLVYIFRFTAEHTNRVLRNEATPEVLIDINIAVMRGLRRGEEVVE